MKRGMLYNSAPRGDRKVLASVGFSIFSDCCPATVSAFETVFLCAANSVFIFFTF